MLLYPCKVRLSNSVILILFALYECSYAAKYDACERGSCLPGTGNLLIGRENRLSATSTCGLRGPERYCVITSLEKKQHCHKCDSRAPVNKDNISHRIENVVPKAHISARKLNWWQSENGVQNVSIQLDLEAEFYFTHLYMKFKTFRPAGALVERSLDYGSTWKVYEYFAFDCAKQFPGIPKDVQSNLSIPYCNDKYSAVTPIQDGEVILKVLPPMLENNIDPYSEEIQNLVKITNLRVNFTKLHTLGDDLLDNRTDIKEKYYYAIWEMIVGGSCACYGHADRCVPLEGVDSKPNMINGRCECTHNTTGLNCEKCEDLYNDLKWKPAIGKETNACQKCNCNNHATSCHFDSKVFESTGRISGGVCDSCQHNTMGKNCEQCKHFYYQDPNKDFSDPDICLQCDCDPSGSTDGGICDSRTDPANDLISGRCHCKKNVEGRRCDTCKNGFWNFTEANPDGCQACSCNITGTYGNQGCNKDTGECTCKRNVVGRNCNQCILRFWGLSDIPEGCRHCDCDPGGSIDDFCDVFSGQCKCRPHLTGRTCNVPNQAYFAPSLDYTISEGEVARCQGICSVEIRSPYPNNNYVTSWTGPGFIRVGPNSSLNFPIDVMNVDSDFNIIIRYEPQAPYRYENVHVTLIRPNEISANSSCFGKNYNNDVREVTLPPDSTHVVVDPPFCLEKNKNYVVRLTYSQLPSDVPTASILIDSFAVIPRIEAIPFMQKQQMEDFQRNRCHEALYSVVKTNISEICKAYHFSIGAYVYGGGHPCDCDLTGSKSTICEPVGGRCECKPNVIGRKCDMCAPGTYGFGPEGCKPCDCHSSGALDNFCDVTTGQCKCRSQTYGRICDQCQPGYWNYPNCERCFCHGHADVCDSYTGVCLGCKDFTEGGHCDRCIEGFYGDPRINVNIPCRMCPCPGTIESGHSYAARCYLDPRSQDVICECEPGYSGARCESCSENYFGNPDIAGGKCSACNCSDNVDILRPGNCDPSTGKCLKCLYNTDGFHCEFCKAGYYGDALRQSCRECVCDFLGTDKTREPCNKFTGQCPCLPNVTGLECNQCLENHWKIASGFGCEPCNCDPVGSDSEQCNLFDGQCSCKPGFGGRRCNQCQTNYWGDPNKECFPCDCNPVGSALMQCDQVTGHCVCSLGIGGPKCDQCARGFLGQMPYCTPCGECFDNWDLILNYLKNQTKLISDKAKEIIKTGASGSYIKEFEAMEKKLAMVRQSLQNTSASTLQLVELDKLISNIRSEILPPKTLDDVRSMAENVTQRVTLLNLALTELNAKVSFLNQSAQELKDNSTKLQEGNVEGALNLTREAYNRAQKVKQKNLNTQNTLDEAERSCKKTEALIFRYRGQFEQDLKDNNNNLQKLSSYVNTLENEIPELNQQVCGKIGKPCDDACGGAGCGRCGGFSCDEGALTKAENALKYAEDTEKLMQEKETKIGELYRGITQARTEARNALNVSRIAHEKAEITKNESALALNHTLEKIAELEKFINNSHSTPSAIRELAAKTMQKTIDLQPEKITELAQKINDIISSLTNIDAIIRDTENDLNRAKSAKHSAVETKTKTENILHVAGNVTTTLDQAERLQNLANLAIQAANENITLARKNLGQISEQSTEAQRVLNETTKDFADVEDHFKKLQTDFLKNSADAQKVEDELKIVVQDVEQTRKNTLTLTVNFQNATAELDKKAQNSTEASNNSKILSEKASQLFANVTLKIGELTDFERQFTEQDKDLKNLEDAISKMKNKMNQIFDDIKRKSDYYQNCKP